MLLHFVLDNIGGISADLQLPEINKIKYNNKQKFGQIIPEKHYTFLKELFSSIDKYYIQ